MSFLSKHIHTVLLCAILLIGAVLRLYMIGPYQIFLGDEGRDVLVAYGILHGKLTLLGPTASVGGFFFGPIYYYMIAPFLWLAHYDPVGPAAMVALFATATIYLLYRVVKDIFSPAVGLVAAFLYATSSLLVTFSRSSWNPHVVPFFVLLTVLSLFSYIKKENKKWILLAGFFYGITFELHFVTLFFAAAVIAFIGYILWTRPLMAWIKKLIVAYLVFGAGFAVGISPIIAFELRHQFVNTRNIITFMFHSKDAGSGAQMIPTIVDVFTRIFTRGVLAFPEPVEFAHYAQWQLAVWNWSGIILGCAAVGLFLFLLVDVRKKNRETFLKYLFVALWLAFGVVGFGFYKKNIYEYYFEFLFPVSIMLSAGLFVYLWHVNRMLRLFIPCVIVGILVLNIFQLPFRYPPNNQVSQTKVIAQEVLNETNGKPYNFALITGGNSDYAYRYYLTIWGHPPVTIDNSIVDPERRTVTDQLLIVCESVPCSPLGYSLWEVAGFGRADIVSKTHLSVVDIYKLKHYTGPQ